MYKKILMYLKEDTVLDHFFQNYRHLMLQNVKTSENGQKVLKNLEILNNLENLKENQNFFCVFDLLKQLMLQNIKGAKIG